MSIKLMKQRWLVEETDDKKDSTDIVDMDIDEKDEYEIISEMEKPTKFSIGVGAENEEPRMIGTHSQPHGAVGSLETKKKRSSRWDVGAPFSVQLDDFLTQKVKGTAVEALTDVSMKVEDGVIDAEISDNLKEKIYTQQEVAEKISNMKLEEGIGKNDEFLMFKRENHQISSHEDIPLEEIALPCDPNPCNIALPPETPIGAIGSAKQPIVAERKSCGSKAEVRWNHAADEKVHSVKPKVIMKWKFTKTAKGLPSLKELWEPETEVHAITKIKFESQPTEPKLGEGAESSLFIREADRNQSQASQQAKELAETVLPTVNEQSLSELGSDASFPAQLKMKSNEGNTGLVDCELEEIALIKTKGGEEVEQPRSDEGPKSPFEARENSISTMSTSDLYYCHSIETKPEKLVIDQSEPLPDLAQTADELWLSMCLPRNQPLQGTKVPLDPALIFHQWKLNSSKIETNVEVEQESSASSLSTATSPASVYSFNSTPKTFSSPDIRLPLATEEHKSFPIGSEGTKAPLHAEVPSVQKVDEVQSIVSSSEDLPKKAPASQPTPYEHLDDNVILCDESLIKEARKQYAKVEAFDAGIKGWGLRAAEPLEPGRFIIEYVGEVIDADEMIRRGRRYGKDPKHVHHYLMALKNGAVIDATARGNISRFINHSCDPNCESQKWTVDRQLRVGFFAIKPIAVGEEIVFDYQLERYGRKAQRCFCGAANCRGRIGDDSESEEEDKAIEDAEVEESEENEDAPSGELKVKSMKKRKLSRMTRKRRKQTTQHYNKAILNTLSRGPPRNRTQVRDLIRLMVQVEQAPQRSSLIQCVRFAHPDVLRLFIQECGLRLLYVFLATDYPIDDQQAVLQLQIKSLDLLDVMPIVNKNQVNDSHLAATVEKIASKRGPVDDVVEEIVRRIVDAVCCDVPSTSHCTPSTSPADPNPVIERLHCEMVTKAERLMRKWKGLREEYRIPRRERSMCSLAQHDVSSRYVRKTEEDEKNKRVIVDKKDDGSTLWRLSGFGPPPKRRYFDRRRFTMRDRNMPIFVKDLTHLENEDFKLSPVTAIDLTPTIDDEDGAAKPKKRRSRFDIVGERNPSSMYELYETDCDPYAPPPPTLLPEAMFVGGLPDSLNFYHEQPFPEFFDWNAVYAKYDPSSAAYQQFIDYYQQQQYPLMGPPPCSVTPQKTEIPMNILEAPSPPPPKRPKTPEEKPNMLTIGPIDMENPTDEDIEMLERISNSEKFQHLAALKAKRAEIKKNEVVGRKGTQKSSDANSTPPPPPPSQSKQSLWVQATTEEGAVYYYNRETRESAWTLPDESEGGNASADTTTDRTDTRATFKAEIVKYVGGMLEPIRKLKFASADDYKYVLRKLTHTILEKELKRVDETELKVTESVRDKARKFVGEYLLRLGDGQYSRKNKSHNAY